MRFLIKHEGKGRLRVHVNRHSLTYAEADILQMYLENVPGIQEVKVYERSADAAIVYHGDRGGILQALQKFGFDRGQVPETAVAGSSREINAEYKEKLIDKIIIHYGKRWLLPMPIRSVITTVKSVKYIAKGVKTLWQRKIEVPVLDATAIGVSVLRSDFTTAGSIMFLLEIGELLEEWTHKKSVEDLARSMSLQTTKVWLVTEGGEDVKISIADVKVGDKIRVQMGNVIPFDGVVCGGEAMVNQSSLTGESMPVAKHPGSPVYAGTVAEEGECVISVEKSSGSGRYDRVVHMIEESEKLKSTAEDKASRMADRLVPYTLGGTALTYLLTRNVTKMLAVLMVDFSCALKLAIPIAVLSAMRESSGYHISVKGGRFLEAVAKADTIVFDKTGTLTYATPTVAAVIPFGGHDEAEMLRLAACLEEHYPHSMANAVVAEAKRHGLTHEEYHSQVQYVVAHGISSMVEGKKVIIGSAHFAFEDEGCRIPAGEQPKFDALPAAYSHLYLCMDGELAAVICIHDPLRREAREAVRALHESGFTNVVMMTGDNRRTAESVAAEVGVDAVYAEVLPEDKAAFIRQEKAKGHTVIMVGDGVNDSPALSEADAGIAISTGAAIAREIADITVASEDLFALVTLRRLGEALMERIHGSYRFIVGFNLTLIALGVAGVLPPTTSALLHNGSTLGISLRNMTDLLNDEENTQK
mgnify:CR=1 FL=1